MLHHGRWCYGNDCAKWGYQKAIDGRTVGLNSLTLTGAAGTTFNAHVQFDLGSVRSDILSVRIMGPGTSALAYAPLPVGLQLYLSPGTNFTAGTLCEANITLAAVGEEYLATCPLGVSGRYVTIYQTRPGTRIALQEVTAMYEGG